MAADQSDHGIRPVAVAVEPDAHGQAAFLLAESILHALVDAGALTNAEAVGIVTNAIEANREGAAAARDSPRANAEFFDSPHEGVRQLRGGRSDAEIADCVASFKVRLMSEKAVPLVTTDLNWSDWRQNRY